jgi:hypothetical protein
VSVVPCFAVLLVSATVAQAGPILVGVDNTGAGTVYVGNQLLTTLVSNIARAQAFTLTSAATASDVSVWVNYGNVPSTFTLQLTDSIGPGTTGSDVLFSQTGTYGATASWVDIELGSLALSSGTYYLVMTSDTPVSEGPGCSANDCYTGEWGANGTPDGVDGSIGSSYYTSDIGPGAPTLTDFSSSNTSPVIEEFQLNEDPAAPEPSTFQLLAISALCAFSFRRRTLCLCGCAELLGRRLSALPGGRPRLKRTE